MTASIKELPGGHHVPRYFALVYRESGIPPNAREDDIYSTYKACKWDWLEYQALRFRAALGLDATIHVTEIFPTGDGCFTDDRGEIVVITDKDEKKAA